MINTERLISMAKHKLGYPYTEIEIDESSFSSLILESHRKFDFYSKLNKNLNKEEIDSIEHFWIESYFFALTKEVLGNVRGKLSGDIKSAEKNIKLDYIHLLKEAEAEKKSLIKILYPEYYYENKEDIVILAFYINIGNLETSEVDILTKKMSNNLNLTLPSFVKNIIIPIKNKNSYVEIVYSSINDQFTEKFYDLSSMMSEMDTDLKKYLYNEK